MAVRTRLQPLRVAVFGVLQAAEDGTQDVVPGGLVSFKGFGVPGKFGHAGGEAGTAARFALGGEDAPREDAVGPFERGVGGSGGLQQVFERVVQAFGDVEGEAYGEGGVVFGEGYWIFSR